MRREDMLRHARECRQWAGTARTEKARLAFLKDADTWELLALRDDDRDVSETPGFPVGPIKPPDK